MHHARTRLTDATVRALPLANDGQYIVRDTELPGFFVVVGKRTKTYTIQTDIRSLGRRRTVRKAIGRHGLIGAREARAEARRELGSYALGLAKPPSALTVRDAWCRYRAGHLEAQGRRPRTVESYCDTFERLLRDWLDMPPGHLSEDPVHVAVRFDEITRDHGPSAANHAMRNLRALYLYARKRMDRKLPPGHPASAIDFHPESRRDTALLPEEFPVWWGQLRKLPNPIRREFHLFMLLSGSRPDALKRARWEHFHADRRVLHFPDPKGGADRAFDLSLSRAMLRSLARARRAGRLMHPDESSTWIFPAATASGHIAEHKEARSALSDWGVTSDKPGERTPLRPDSERWRPIFC
jgi:integrase